jgi:hypothetical protein
MEEQITEEQVDDLIKIFQDRSTINLRALVINAYLIGIKDYMNGVSEIDVARKIEQMAGKHENAK